MPIWVTLPHLSLYMFNETTLASIADLICNPVQMDLKTRKRTNLGAPRLFVELDVSKTHRDRVWIGFKGKDGIQKTGFWQKVEFEELFSFCGNCRKLNHLEEACGDRRQMQAEPEPLATNISKGDNNTTTVPITRVRTVL